MSQSNSNNHLPTEPTVEIPQRWLLVACLGSGGQAEVWLAEDRHRGQRVALKILHPGQQSETRARWMRELRLGMQVEHPHLVRTLDVLEIDDNLVAVLEFFPAGSLARRLAFRGPQAVELVAAWARQGLDALAYLHNQQIVHRDVKPSNLLLDADEAIKLADFGLAGELDWRREADRAPVGTHSHMPTEQGSGLVPMPWWDLHGLGVTLYQALTGELPPRDENGLADLVAEGLREPVGRMHWLAVLIDRLLEHRQALRWPDAQHALAALERLP